MKDHGDGMESTTTRDGITVHQTYQEERFGVPTVALKFVSEREESTEVRVTVDLVPDLQIEEVGFHPEYGRENWTVDGDRLEFTDTIGPDEEVTTMYAVESLGDDQLDSLLENLSIEGISGGTPEPEYDTQPESQPGHSTGTGPAEDASAGELATETESGLEDDDQEGLAADSAESDDSIQQRAAEPSEAPGEEETVRDEEAAPGEEETDHDEEDQQEEETEDGDESESGDDEDSTGTVAGRVELSEERARAQEEQTADTPAKSELSGVSTATLLEEVQDRMNDLKRSVEVIEEFDTQHGRPVEAFARVEDELAALDERLDDIEDDVDSLAEDQDELESKVSTLQEWRDRVKSTLSALSNQ